MTEYGTEGFGFAASIGLFLFKGSKKIALRIRINVSEIKI